jgi:hypothetical protein
MATEDSVTAITFVSSLFNDNNNIILNINTNKLGKVQHQTQTIVPRQMMTILK